MLISVYTRHSKDCKKKEDTRWKRCECPKWHYCAAWGRKQQSAKTRSWEEAERRARRLEQGLTTPEITGKLVAAAVKDYLRDAESRNLSSNYHRKLEREMNELAEWARLKPVPSMRHWTLALLEEFRNTWTVGPRTKRNRQERLRGFFKYCDRHSWIEKNHAKYLSPIRVSRKPTVPFSREEWDNIMKAVETYKSNGEIQRDRARALLLLLRWSGLRLGDAARIERTRLDSDGKLLLYMAKTGEPVYVPLPPEVAKQLRKVKNSNPKYFFWSGKTNKETPVYRWWETLKAIFKNAGVPDGQPFGGTLRFMNSPFAWPGGKRYLLKTLLSSIPQHQIYAEVFAGSAKLLFAKDPSPIEVVNDVNGDVTNFFRVVKHRAAELAERMEIECVHAGRFKELRNSPNPEDEIDRALRFAYLVWYSFGAKGEHFASSNAKNFRLKRPISTIHELLRKTADRLSTVLIEQRDFSDIIDRYDSPETFFYLDPPYVSFEKNGRYDPLTAERRSDLFQKLANIKGTFLMSFDACDEIRSHAREHQFNLHQIGVQYTLAGAHQAKNVTELLITNHA